jgi:hypothetical protein
MGGQNFYFKHFRIERISEGKSKDIAFLFKVVFNALATEEAINQKHLSCNGEHKFIGYIAYDKESNTPVAHYAVYPRYMIYQGERVLTAQSGDTMANPNFRKKSGLFAKLAELTFSLCEEVGVDLVTGFPNSFSYLTFVKKLNFLDLPKLFELQFVENKFELRRFTHKSKILVNLHQVWIRLVFRVLFGKGNMFQNSNEQNIDLSYVDRDKSFFESKKTYNKLLISHKGISLLIKVYFEINRIEIGDIETCDDKCLLTILKKLKMATRFGGLRFLNYQSSVNASLYKKLLPFSNPGNEASLFILREFKNKIPHSSISLQLLDSDGF